MWSAIAFFGMYLLAQSGLPAHQPVQTPERWANAAVVSTTGKGVLTLCRDWIVRHSCREYGDISVPARIAVGDRIEITFGSNPKTIRFHVKGIMVHKQECVLIPEYEAMPTRLPLDEPLDMLTVKDCIVGR